MYLLYGVLAGVQALRWVVHQSFHFASTFSSSGASNLGSLTMGIASALSLIATDISLLCWQMMARLKANDSLRQIGWPAAVWVANNVVKMVIFVGAIKSASKFDNVTIVLLDLIALSGLHNH